ncbi:MAG: hypothetical protein AAFR67_03095, partial [Chloroflexota bacterium]
MRHANTPKWTLVVLVLIIGLILGSLAFVSAQDDTASTTTVSAPTEQDSVALTIYNQGTALVQDVRTYTFASGRNLVNFASVASSIDAKSVSFASLSDPFGTRVLEQNYIYDLVGSSALLRRYIDEIISVTTMDSTVYTGTLLSGASGIILQTDAGEVVVISSDDVQDIQFPELPSGLITQPTLRWLVDSATEGEQQVEVTYLTSGINWRADYNILLARDNTVFDINGWVTLNNSSGTAYADATIKLVAGDVNRVQPQAPIQPTQTVLLATATALPTAGGAPIQQREFFEYQLYEIARDVNIGNNSTMQVEFVESSAVPTTTIYVYDASPRFYGYGNFNNNERYGQTNVRNVGTYMEFTTDEEDGIGADLPAGRVRIYQEDIDGSALFIRSQDIEHTPEGEDVELFLGNAFDLLGERTQTDFIYIDDDTVEETFEIRLQNFKDDETVQIRVPERLTRGSNWEILDASMEYTQLNAFTIEFRADVPPG